jgi:hypothetical protein
MLRALGLSLGLALPLACGSDVHTDDGDCPRFDVTPDAAVTGFTAVGEWRTDSVCATYCPTDFPVCQLGSQSTVRCQRACG